MLCMGFEPGAAGWKVQTDLLSNGGRQRDLNCYLKMSAL